MTRELIDPKEVPITRQDGKVVTFIFSKFPATLGREIVAKYPVANLPKLGEYGVSEETMLKLMGCVGVVTTPGQPPLMLETKALVDNHAKDWETLAQIEWGMLEYNCSFFGNGKTSDFFASIGQNLRAWIISTLTALSAASSQKAAPPTAN